MESKNKKVKIVHIINNLGSGGAEKLLVDLLQKLELNKQIDLHLILLSRRNDVYYESIKGLNIDIIYLDSNKLYGLKTFLKLRTNLIAINPDIIHGHLFPILYYLYFYKLITPFKKTKYIFSEHNTTNRRRKLFFLRPVEMLIYSCFHKIISVSNGVQIQLQKWLHTNNKTKYIVLDNAININKIENSKPIKNFHNILNIPPSARTIIMVARFTEQKNHELLIKSLLNLDEIIYLILVGEGPLLNNYIQLAKELNLYDRIRFLGYRSDVYNLIKSSDVFVLSSFYEGFGIAALEAMACGIPVLGSNVDGLKDVLLNGGVVFDSAKDLVFLINKLLNDLPYYKKISNDGKIKSNLYSIINYTDKLTLIYFSLLL
jgi:glycosyltransferase involved in cell wall biosynthesis